MKAALFDLDGTLVDTAPDMAGTANDMRLTRGLEPLPYEALRPHVSNGARALVCAGLPDSAEPARDDEIAEFLERYATRIARESGLFAGMETLLASLEAIRVPWGVVTNKPGGLTDALLDALDLTARAEVVIAGDTLTVKKPHPEPLLEAARRLSISATDCIYVGDARRDVEAGNAAGMRTVVAAFGYIPASEDVVSWGADEIVSDVTELHHCLRRHSAGRLTAC